MILVNLKNGLKFQMTSLAFTPIKQRGTILIVVLLLVILLEVIALSYLSNQKLSIYSLENLMMTTEFKFQLDFVEKEIEKNFLSAFKDQPGASHYDVKLAHFTDMQKKLNINEFIVPENREKLISGLKKIALLEKYKYEGNIDFLISNLLTYLTMYEKYYKENSLILPFSHINDLTEMPIEKQDSDFLKKAFVVLPVLVPLNVNTMTAEGLLGIAPDISYPEAGQIIKLRDQNKPFSGIHEFSNINGISNLNLNIENLATTTQFYLMDYTIEYKTLKYHLQSLVEIITEDKNSKMVIRWRQFG